MRALLAGIAVVGLASGCHSAMAPAQPQSSACTQLGGTVGSGDVCEVRDIQAAYQVDLRFPMSYPDQKAVNDFITQRRAEFTDWIASAPPRPTPFELHVSGRTFQSGEGDSGTRSLVLTIGDDTGVHPVTTFHAFNYNLATHGPIAYGNLFKPGSDPLAILNPIVAQRIIARDREAAKAANDLTATAYQQFAITDDAIIFFFNQDGVLPHEDGPLEVEVPRRELTSILA